MNVLMSADAVGGVWRYAMDLGGALVARGVNVTVAVMGPPPSAAQAFEAERRRLTVVSRPYRLEWMDEPWDDVARAGDWLLALERAVQADIVHLNGYCHAALPWRSMPLVVAHSCVCSWWRAVRGEEAPPSWQRYREAVSGGLAAARVVVAPTAAMLRALHREYGVCPRARVIPNGLPFEPVETSAPKEPAILAAGRVWDEGKNIRALCDVAADVPWPVHVAGDDRGIRNTTLAFGAARHLGCMPTEDLSRWYARAAIYALPALYEPFGLSVLEAAQAGCALVLGDIESLRENWQGAAEFVPPDDRQGLANALRRLIDDPARRVDLATRARSRSRRFSIQTTADTYLRVYDGLTAAVCSS
jgi:glycosyltransferase involved in cell wall biosynthesis